MIMRKREAETLKELLNMIGRKVEEPWDFVYSKGFLTTQKSPHTQSNFAATWDKKTRK
jgi:hypothetical protein